MDGVWCGVNMQGSGSQRPDSKLGAATPLCGDLGESQPLRNPVFWSVQKGTALLREPFQPLGARRTTRVARHQWRVLFIVIVTVVIAVSLLGFSSVL